jgi:hypothetical protein
MPIIQRIEISNILNLRREDPWKASWPYEIFEIRDRNAAINIPNGCGKSTIMKSILAMLVGQRTMLKELRSVHYAPRSTGLYSHIRIQVKINTHGQVNDLVSSSGGELPGEPMVFGLYGNSGENEDVHLYSYKGTFEDCPIGHHEGSKRILVRDDVFLKNLSSSTRLFPSPSNKSESTNSEWKRYISDIFDMPSLLQQLSYQAANGGEGGGSYFDITDERGSNFSTKNYSAKVFYKILAPELLVNVMGEHGEADETSIEDTILIKVSQLLTEKRKSDTHKKTLEMTENTLKKLETSLSYANELINAKQTYAAHASNFMTEIAAVKTVVVDNPIPGIPKLPPAAISPLARSMVLQNGQWYIPDRVMAEFTNETSSDVNRRASERNNIELLSAQNSQVIDFTCHLAISKKGGHASKLYSRGAATALLNKTTNFTREWTLDNAISAVNESFDWVEANADTNPARLLLNAKEVELGLKVERQSELMGLLTKHSEDKADLLTKRNKIGAAQLEYHKVVDSNLFTKVELASLSQTGLDVIRELEQASRLYDSHITKVSMLAGVYKLYNGFIEQYGHASNPKDIANSLAANLANTASTKEIQLTLIKEERTKRPSLQMAYDEANKSYVTAQSMLQGFQKIKPLLVLFNEIFGDISAKGLEHDVRTKLNDAKNSQAENKNKLSSLKSRMDDLSKFRLAYPEQEPAKWLDSRLAKWIDIGDELKAAEINLADKKSRRSDLDRDAVAPSKVAREVMEMAGTNAIPLHVAIENMNLSVASKEKVLILFSAMLHTPVFNSVDEAALTAKAFFEKEIESPVFVFDELKEFCHSESIMLRETIANTWLVGVRTRPVDCLLNPELVANEKALLDKEIELLQIEIADKTIQREKYNQTSDEVAIARVAQSSIADGVETQYKAAIEALSKIDSTMSELERRASDDAREAIKAMAIYETNFINTDEGYLVEDSRSKLDLLQTAKLNLEGFDAHISKLDAELEESNKLWAKAFSEANEVPKLQEIQSFIDTPSNLSLMQDADKIKDNLIKKLEILREKSKFDFNLAQEYLAADDIAKVIESQLTHLTGEIQHIQKILLPAISEEIERLRKTNDSLRSHSNTIDNFIRVLINKYREFKDGLDRNEYVLDEKKITRHLLSDNGADLLEIKDLNMQVEYLLNMASDEHQMDNTSLREAMKNAKKEYDSANKLYGQNIDYILEVQGLDLPSHAKISLTQSKDDPTLLHNVYAVTKTNFEKNKIANDNAQNHLKAEWEGISEWLAAFTRQLDVNLKAMKSAFKPKRDSVTNRIVKAGFEIEASLANIGDVEATLDEVVELIRQHETMEHTISESLKGESKAERNRRRTQLLTKIRDTFYQKVILNPSIKMCMPSISDKPIELEKRMVSTGQGVAMTLLWLVKMSAYITDREILSYGTEKAKLKRARAAKTQFTIIDGAFSSLSDENLIKDALDGVSDSYGAFQLIITVHDRDYKNNFDYFPTLIEARSIDGRLMYAANKSDLTTNALKGPQEDVGTMANLSITKVPLNEFDGAIH